MSALQADILTGFSRMPKSYVCKTLPVRLIFLYCWGHALGKGPVDRQAGLPQYQKIVLVVWRCTTSLNVPLQVDSVYL